MVQTKTRGFTLVELAIVITIIGLLIGGVLKGQELLENARITSISTGLKSYQTAYITFRDIYKGRPGDLLEARNLITGCTSANSCVNGNGDGNVGAITSNADYTMSGETSQFWKHLALAGLIGGIDPTASANEFGKSHPSNPITGGYVMASWSNVVSVDMQLNFPGKLNVMWYPGFVGDAYGWVATPFQAWQLDVKMDDGKPFTGDVRAGSMPYHGGGCETDQAGVLGSYTPSIRNEKCELHCVLEQ